MKNILEMLEASALLYPDKTVFADSEKSYNYSDFCNTAKRIGTALSEKHCKKPVAVLMPRGADCLAAAFGVVYSGVPYVILDCEMPAKRIASIVKTLGAAAVIASDLYIKEAQTSGADSVIRFSDAANYCIDVKKLKEVRKRMTESDILYVLFTSGSTGVPKGCAVTHRNVISYVDWFSTEFGINEGTVFGSQTPFYFSMSVSDVFATVRCGATMHIIEKSYFMFPIKLIEFMNERKVNTVYWVPSALCIIANLRVLDYAVPTYLKKVMFAGEVMPQKPLNYWRRCMPDVMYANLFGPTETTDICTYYVVDRDFEDHESLPIGKACDNCNVFIIGDDGQESDEGELYVRGPFVAKGYYNDPKRTAAAFVQNPLSPEYPEIVYKTGDIVRKNSRKELEYVARKDNQIKRMGYRIEPGEIEAAASSADGVTVALCIFDSQSERLKLVYSGKANAENVKNTVCDKVPVYMYPDEYVRIGTVPYNQNGKIDRAKIKEGLGIK